METPVAESSPASPRSDSIEALVAEIEAFGSSLGHAFVDLWLVEAALRWRGAEPASHR